ncbi:MAG: hypothetical protein IT318_04005 [Anaerolineales bacterium]|nr:hypothetical protein [Anaerolineales bacterium]
MTDRETQTAAYWGEAFEIEESDLDYLYNLLLEEETPLSTGEMALAIIERRVEREAQAAKQRERGTTLYRPKDAFTPGQQLVFPALDYAVGTVIGLRPGKNPTYNSLNVVQVDFGEGRPMREFASGLLNHKLNQELAEGTMGEVLPPEALFEQYGEAITKQLEARLSANPDIARLAGRWFPRALLATVNIGNLNLAEAVLDVAGGGPLPTDVLLKDAGLPTNINPRLQAFSLHYSLQEDQRFDEVGPAGQVLWYLRRLEPPEVLHPPRRLENSAPPADLSGLNPTLRALVAELDDEFSLTPPGLEPAQEVKVTLTFPHRWVGTLPLSPRLLPLFPTAYESPRIRFMFVDVDTGEQFPGWVVRAGGYVFGLHEWYHKYDMPAGGHLVVQRGGQPGEVAVQALRRRPAREWVRTAAAGPDGRLAFSMQKQLIGVEYDDLMMVAAGSQSVFDEVWLKSQSIPFARLVADVFRELAKLNPQSAVHAKTLYAAVNAARRSPPGPVFAELMSQPYYALVGDAYWRFDQAQWTE